MSLGESLAAYGKLVDRPVIVKTVDADRFLPYGQISVSVNTVGPRARSSRCARHSISVWASF